MHRHPSDPKERAIHRKRISDDQHALADRQAARLGRSIKCGIDLQHADVNGGCANDGSGCLCECHDHARETTDA